MKPLNFFAYWNMQCSFDNFFLKFVFFFLCFFILIASMTGIALFIFGLITNPTPIAMIPSAFMAIIFAFEAWQLFIKDYYFYRKSFKK